MDAEPLSGAVDRLSAEFAPDVDRVAVEVVVATAYEALAARATTTAFLSLLAERFARQQLQARLRTADPSPTKVPAVLFLCVHNAGRSHQPRRPSSLPACTMPDDPRWRWVGSTTLQVVAQSRGREARNLGVRSTRRRLQ